MKGRYLNDAAATKKVAANSAIRNLLIAGLIWTAMLPPVVLAAECSLDWVCVRPQTQDDGVVLFLGENLRDFPVTVSLRVRSRTLEGTPNPVTMTIPARKTTTLLRMNPRGGGSRVGFRYFFDWAVGDREAQHDDEYLYALPYANDARYRILQGYQSGFSHTGEERYAVDFDMEEGTPVHAAREGVVARVVEKHDQGCWRSECGAYANFIVIMHSDNTTGEYYHLQQDGALVAEGDKVRRGQLIGLSGNTGHTTMPHLHFGVYSADSWGATRSIPVRFDTAEGLLTTPQRGRGYTAGD
ncbi:MAG: M23 family metallopeptidase [Gammaproteobacteria bacterium]|nr:M23 family metallopeptidase [Gammaproteobacteria bacterium]